MSIDVTCEVDYISRKPVEQDLYSSWVWRPMSEDTVSLLFPENSVHLQWMNLLQKILLFCSLQNRNVLLCSLIS